MRESEGVWVVPTQMGMYAKIQGGTFKSCVLPVHNVTLPTFITAAAATCIKHLLQVRHCDSAYLGSESLLWFESKNVP
jgi:hypothetical protein